MSGSPKQSSRSPRTPKKLEKGTSAVPSPGSTSSSPRDPKKSPIAKELLAISTPGSSSGSPRMPKKIEKGRPSAPSPRSTSSSPRNPKKSAIEKELLAAASPGSLRSSPRLQKKLMPLMEEEEEPAAAPILRRSARLSSRPDEPMGEELPEGPSTSGRKIGHVESPKGRLKFKKDVAGADALSTSGGKRQEGKRKRAINIPPLQINPPSDDEEEEDMPCKQMSKLRFYPKTPKSPNEPNTPSPKKRRFNFE